MEHGGTRDGFATIISAQVLDATSAVRLAAGPAVLVAWMKRPACWRASATTAAGTLPGSGRPESRLTSPPGGLGPS
jgi:hypothetical protein